MLPLLELPQTARRAGRTLRLAVSQVNILQTAAGLSVAAQLYLMKLNDPCQGLNAKGMHCFDCVHHGKPKEPAKRKCKRAGQITQTQQMLVRCMKVYNFSRMA